VQCFNIESIPAGTGWSKVECKNGSQILDGIRKEFKKEWEESKIITDIIDALVSPSTKPNLYYLATSVQFLVFQSGWLNLGDECIVLILVAMSGTIEATIEERKSHRRTAITFTTNSEVLITGGCSMWIPDNSKVVCVLLGIGR